MIMRSTISPDPKISSKKKSYKISSLKILKYFILFSDQISPFVCHVPASFLCCFRSKIRKEMHPVQQNIQDDISLLFCSLLAVVAGLNAVL
jgi:hypothetical protein